MQASYAERFSREMGCTESEWLGWLPAAIGAHPWQREGCHVQVQIQEEATVIGRLTLNWRVEPARRIALMHLPCLWVSFAFEGLDPGQRYAFMRRFDLYMQRGGG